MSLIIEVGHVNHDLLLHGWNDWHCTKYKPTMNVGCFEKCHLHVKIVA